MGGKSKFGLLPPSIGHLRCQLIRGEILSFDTFFPFTGSVSWELGLAIDLSCRIMLVIIGCVLRARLSSVLLQFAGQILGRL